jgi:hypothetical protein
MLACSKSAERLYEPSELTLARQTTGAVAGSAQSGADRALRCAEAPRPPAARPPTAVTFLNGTEADISIWWTQCAPFNRR